LTVDLFFLCLRSLLSELEELARLFLAFLAFLCLVSGDEELLEVESSLLLLESVEVVLE